MDFYKYSGSGNDFIFINNMQGDKNIRPSLVASWCHRRDGIGADGVIIIGKSQNYDYTMRIFNADGSMAEMCGNASRCSAHFTKNILGLGKDEYQFETLNGVYLTSLVAENEVKVKMTELYDVDAINVNDLSGKRALYLNTGVPHTVIQVSSVEDVNVLSLGRAIRNDVRFPGGTNVDFFEVIDQDSQTIKLRVYERGVENETLCCGTGIMATAVACAKFFGWSGEVKVHVPGGLLKANVDQDLKELFFQGKIHLVYQGQLSE